MHVCIPGRHNLSTGQTGKNVQPLYWPDQQAQPTDEVGVGVGKLDGVTTTCGQWVYNHNDKTMIPLPKRGLGE